MTLLYPQKIKLVNKSFNVYFCNELLDYIIRFFFFKIDNSVQYNFFAFVTINIFIIHFLSEFISSYSLLFKFSVRKFYSCLILDLFDAYVVYNIIKI